MIRAPKDIRKVERHFCSRECFGLWEHGPNNPASRGAACRNCWQWMRASPGVRYCSAECRQAVATRRAALKERTCPICDGQFYPVNSKSTYCSVPCANEAHAERMGGTNNPNYQHGNGHFPYSDDFHETRLKVRDRDGGRCVQCGSSGPLHCHHVDHDKFNDDHRNLITLCSSCHVSYHKFGAVTRLVLSSGFRLYLAAAGEWFTTSA